MHVGRVVGAIESRGSRLAVVAVALLVAGAIALMAFPNAIETITGKTATPLLTAPDELSRPGRDDPTSFLIERDVVELRVDTPMTVREFLDLYRLNRPNLRKQVLEQLGNPGLDTAIAAGTRLKLHLTPVALDVPGSTTTTRPAN